MNEYQDGSFGAIFPAKDLIEQFFNFGTPENLKCTHWGTPEELEKIKSDKIFKRDIEIELKALSERLDDLEASVHGETTVNGIITKLSPEIIKQFLK